MTDFLDMPLRQIIMSTRTRNCLINEGFETLRPVMQYSGHELYRIPNFGRKSLNELNQLLDDHGKPRIRETNKPVYLPVSLSGEVLSALRARAASNDREIEHEAAVIIASAVGVAPHASSLAERVERLEQLVASVVKGA